MAKLRGGIKPLFGRAQIQKMLDEQIEKWERGMIETLQYAGEQFMNDARNNGTYKDRTGNLRASIGYVVLKDGKVVQSRYSGGAGGNAAKEKVAEVSPRYQEGFVLIGVAGMHYAAYVEARKYDVISGSAPTVNFLKDIFDGINI